MALETDPPEKGGRMRRLSKIGKPILTWLVFQVLASLWRRFFDGTQ